MWADKVLLELEEKRTYSRDDLFRLFRYARADLSESTFRWILYNLLREGKIYKKDFDTYVTKKPVDLPEYSPLYSNKAQKVICTLEKEYPELQFVVFESVLLNEFLNHQIAQNTIYVQVEKDLSSYIFDVLRERIGGVVLYKPNKVEYERYWAKDCIVVLELISQAPLSPQSPHDMTAEKLLVDIVAEKSIAASFSPSEITYVFESVLNHYQVDRRRVNRYAGRRGKTPAIQQYDKNARAKHIMNQPCRE